MTIMTRRARVRPPVCLPAAALLPAGLLLFPSAAAAQPADDSAWDPDLVQTAAEWSDEVPAHVSSTTGNSWLERDGTVEADPLNVPLDRKSTRLNSSHVRISYAVFCLKKKR